VGVRHGCVTPVKLYSLPYAGLTLLSAVHFPKAQLDAIHCRILAAIALGRIKANCSGWGCGYRNALMLLSALILFHPSYASLFSRESNGSDPSLRWETAFQGQSPGYEEMDRDVGWVMLRDP
jgi:hypothetical protein